MARLRAVDLDPRMRVGMDEVDKEEVRLGGDSEIALEEIFMDVNDIRACGSV